MNPIFGQGTREMTLFSNQLNGLLCARSLGCVGLRDVSIGDVVAYTVTTKNVGTFTMTDIEIRDVPPAGFVYVEGSGRARRSGADGELGTEDDALENVDPDGRGPLSWTLDFEPGDLVLFRGRNAIHRVTPTEGGTTRLLVVFAYNDQPGVALSESARTTFYGRTA